MEIDYKEALELLAYNYGELKKENERLEKDSYVLNDLIDWLDEMIKMSNIKTITIVLESVRSKINTLELLENVKKIDKKTTQDFDENDKKVNLTSKSIEKDKVLEVDCKENKKLITQYFKLQRENEYLQDKLDEQTKTYQKILNEQQSEIDNLQRNANFYNEQMNDAVERTVELNKEKKDLKEWLEEEINKLNPKKLELGELNLILDDVNFYSYIQLTEVLERLG